MEEIKRILNYKESEILEANLKLKQFQALSLT